MSEQVEIRLDVPYGGGPDGTLCNDVYLPAGPGPHPALLCFHGGGWAHGSQRQYQEWGPWLAARGYALVTAAPSAAVTDASQAAPGDPIRVRLHRGRLAASVTGTEPVAAGGGDD